MSRRYRTVQFEPLGLLVSARGRVTHTFGTRTPEHRNYYRCRVAGRVRLHAAEQFAAALGLHPSEIWGSEWWEVSA